MGTEAEPVQYASGMTEAEPQVLPLAGDYAGLGGPKTVPLYTPAAFEQPAKPVERNILDEIFLEPTDDQLRAYNRVILKGKVVQNKERLKWEWLWLLSAPVTFFGLSACKPSSLKSIKQFL